MSDLLLVLCWFLTTIMLCVSVCIAQCKIIDLEGKVEELEEVKR